MKSHARNKSQATSRRSQDAGEQVARRKRQAAGEQAAGRKRQDAGGEQAQEQREIEGVMAKMIEEVCSVRDAAAFLGVSRQQVHVLIKSEKIAARRLDNWFWIVHRPSLDRYVKSKSRRGRPPLHKMP